MQDVEGEYIGLRTIQILDEYIAQHRIVYPPLEGRIQFIGHLTDEQTIASPTGFRSGAFTISQTLRSTAGQLIVFSLTVGLLVNWGLMYKR